MDLKAIIAILSGNKWIIITTTIITVITVTVFTFLAKPIYSASTTLRVATASSGVTSYSDYMYADRLINTYTKIATSGPILEELETTLGIQIKPTLIHVSPIPNTELIRITVENPNRVVAQTATNALAEILIAQSQKLYTGGGKSTQEILGEQLAQAEAELNQARQEYDTLVTQSPGDSERIDMATQEIQLKEKTYASLLEQYEAARVREALRENIISMVEPADLPISPIRPRKVLNISLGLLLGLAGGLGLAFLFQNLNNRLYTSEQIEDATELPLIGKIPTVRRIRLFELQRKKSDAYYKESFRRLSTKILALKPINPNGNPPKRVESNDSSSWEWNQKPINPNGNPLKSLLITSAVPGEGKSTIVYSLAKMLAQSGKRVIVLDCDMHIPKQHKLFGLPNQVGLSSVLTQQVPADEAVQKSQYSNLSVLTSGQQQPEPAELLASDLMKALIDLFIEKYDIVLMDSPAILAVTDAIVLAAEVDGVVLVLRRTFIYKEAIQEACKQLASIDAPTLGVVVNDAELNGSYYYYHSH